MSIVTLTIPQAVLLLALHDKTGQLVSSYSKYGIAAASMVDLIRLKYIDYDDREKASVKIINKEKPRSLFLRGCLRVIGRYKQPVKIKTLVAKIAKEPKLIEYLATELCNIGAVSQESKKVYLVFDKPIWPSRYPQFQKKLKNDMAQELFGFSERVDDRLCAIIALAVQIDILKNHYDKEQLKDHKKRIKAIMKGELFATETYAPIIKEANDYINAANVVIIT